MKLEYKILLNRFGQKIDSQVGLENMFKGFELDEKRIMLMDLQNLIVQSKTENKDIQSAIAQSQLKPTYTPCVLIMKGLNNEVFKKIIALPENELGKVFTLFINLFQVGYYRRFVAEKNNPDKWWYWDLSDPNTVKMLSNRS